jgi:hypothetical protein
MAKNKAEKTIIKCPELRLAAMVGA